MGELKKCTKCGRLLPLTEFYLHKGHHRSTCKDCCKKESQEAYMRLKNGTQSDKVSLSQFTPRQLINELINRGYRGKLYYTQEIKLEK